MEDGNTDGGSRGLPLALDPNAKSESRTEPAFIARPAGAPVYHGFVVLEDVVVDGFTLGTITDFELEPSDEGDAFVIAPDGSRAGIAWQIYQETHFVQIRPFEKERWGVYSVAFTHPMRNRKMRRSICDGLCLNFAQSGKNGRQKLQIKR